MADKKSEIKPVKANPERAQRTTRTAPAEGSISGTLQRAHDAPEQLSPHEWRAVQRVAGLRATSRMAHHADHARQARLSGQPIQTKLTVGAADDPYEREADRVASQVLSMSSGAADGVSRKEDEATARRRPAISPFVQRSQRDMSGSFDASQQVERQIAANRNGGSPLPAKLRSELEPRYGADFSSVRVHTGMQSDALNRSIGAQAFTHSNHIYLANGKYNPGTGAGKHLLAHELTHVVQQGGAKENTLQTKATGKRRFATSPIHAVMDAPVSVSRISRRVQRMTVKVTTTPPQNEDAEIKLVSTKTSSFKKGETTTTKSLFLDKSVKVGDSIDVSKPIDFAGQRFYRVNGKKDAQGHDLYVRDTWIKATMSPNFDEKHTHGHEPKEGPGSEALSSGAEMSGTVGEHMFQHQEFNEASKVAGETAKWQQEHGPNAEHHEGATTPPAEHPKQPWEEKGYTYAQDTMFLASDLISFAANSKKIWDIYHDKDMKTWQKVLGISEAGIDMTAKVADMGYRGEEIADKLHNKDVSSFSETTGHLQGSDTVLAAFGGISGTLNIVVKGMQGIKKTTKLVNMVASDDKYSKEEYAEVAGGILKNSAEVALGIVNTIKTIHYALGGGTMIMQAVPILGIIINGMRVIMDGYYLVKSAIQWHKMRKRKSELKQGLAAVIPQKDDQDLVKADASYYRIKEAEQANHLVLQEGYEAKAKKAGISKEKKKKYDEGTSKHEQKAESLEHSMEHYSKTGKPGEQHFTREQLAEYRLAKELRDVNRKRVVRESLHVLSAITQIAGDAITLGGITSGAGAGLKAGAAGLEASMPLIRLAKQSFRNKAAEHQAKEKGILKSASSMLVDTSKSSAAKLQARKMHAKHIIKLAANLEIKDGTFADKAAAKQLKRYLKAAGVSGKQLARHNGDPNEQIKVLVQALGRREFLSD